MGYERATIRGRPRLRAHQEPSVSERESPTRKAALVAGRFVANDDLNQHRHEHDLSRGLFLGEGIRGYRRRIRGGAAD